MDQADQTRSPVVSVILSTFNQGRYLPESIDSVLESTYRDIELIVVDDGSSDATREILSAWADPRLNIIVNGRNLGLTPSLNKAIKTARGDLIARLDTGDRYAPEKLRLQVEYLRNHPGTGLVGTNAVVINAEGKPILDTEVAERNEDLKQGLMRSNQFVHGSVIFTRQVIEDIGLYREPFRYAQDYDLWLRIAERYEVANLSQFLYWKKMTPQSNSVRRKIEQAAYAELAREMARARRSHGRDQLQDLNRDQGIAYGCRFVESYISARRSEDIPREETDGYYYWGRKFYWMGLRREARQYLLKSLGNSLGAFPREGWKMLTALSLPVWAKKLVSKHRTREQSAKS